MKRIITCAFVYAYLMFICFTNHCLEANQVAQKQRPPTKRELKMMHEAAQGTLTKKKLQAYLKGNYFNKPVDINVPDLLGWNALKHAVYYNHPAVVQLLIAAGADLNLQDEDGWTPLIIAAGFAEHDDVMRLLIVAGADITIEDKHHKTARDVATNKAAFDEAVAYRNMLYRARVEQARPIVTQNENLLGDLNKIVMDYAYGPSPEDLPETKQEEEKKACAVEAPTSSTTLPDNLRDIIMGYTDNNEQEEKRNSSKSRCIVQ